MPTHASCARTYLLEDAVQLVAHDDPVFVVEVAGALFVDVGDWME